MITLPELLALHSRGEIKRWGNWLDEEGKNQRADLVALAARQGHPVPEDWAELPGKKLLRRLLDRADEAQIRRNPIQLDEAFRCDHCGADVPVGGRHPRDHCPRCLHSRHVDGPVPGDRASSCGGLLVPIGVERVDGRFDLLYRCSVCGASRRNRVLDDVEMPDDAAGVRRLMGVPSVNNPLPRRTS